MNNNCHCRKLENLKIYYKYTIRNSVRVKGSGVCRIWRLGEGPGSGRLHTKEKTSLKQVGKLLINKPKPIRSILAYTAGMEKNNRCV